MTNTNTNSNTNFSLYGVALDEFHDRVFDKLGVELPHPIIANSIIQRPLINGKRNIAYKLHLDGCPAGYAQDFSTGIKIKYKYSGQTTIFSEAEKQAFKQRLAGQEKQRQKEMALLQSKAAIRAQTIRSQSTPAPPDHPYLIKKGTDPYNLRLYQGALVSAIYDRDKQLVNHQFINPDGTKRFMKHSKLQDCFSVIGQTSEAPMALTEGWATGASVYKKHGHQTFILKRAVESVKQGLAGYPAAAIVVP